MRVLSLNPQSINGWTVQGSILDNDTILIILMNADRNEVFVRYFDDEMKAHRFLTGVVYRNTGVSNEGLA